MPNEFEDADTSQTADGKTHDEDNTSSDDTDSGDSEASEKDAKIESLNKKIKDLEDQRRGLAKKVKEGKTSKTETPADLQARLDTIELATVGDFDDSIADEIRSFAKLKGVTLRQAAKSDYIQFMVKQAEDKARIESASISNSKTGASGKSKIDFTKASPADFDLSTEEGQKQWEQYKKHLREQG